MLTSAGDLALAGTVGLEVAQWRGPLQGLAGVVFTYHCTEVVLGMGYLRRGGWGECCFECGVVDVDWRRVVTP